MGWIRTWLDAWRSEPVVLSSPLPEQVVRDRMKAASISYLRGLWTFSGWGGRHVIGRVGPWRITLSAGRSGIRNSWQPTFRGRLEPDLVGCRLVGKIGWHPFVKAFSAIWLGGVCAILLLFLGAVAAGQVAGLDLLAVLVPLGFIAFFVGLTTFGIVVSRGDAEYLRTWLNERLQTAGSGVPGYRPWDGAAQGD